MILKVRLFQIYPLTGFSNTEPFAIRVLSTSLLVWTQGAATETKTTMVASNERVRIPFIYQFMGCVFPKNEKNTRISGRKHRDLIEIMEKYHLIDLIFQHLEEPLT